MCCLSSMHFIAHFRRKAFRAHQEPGQRRVCGRNLCVQSNKLKRRNFPRARRRTKEVRKIRSYPRTRKLLLASPILAFTLSATTPPVTALADKEKMKPEELVAKHLESIGLAEARAAARSRIITGTAVASFRMGGHGQAQGKALLASQGPKSLITMVFGLVDYPHEKIAYDGQKVTVGQVRPGVRTLLGRFLAANGLAFSEGLAGGTLSAAWPLLDLTSRNAKLQYEGLKKIGKRELHALKYSAPKSSDLKVTLFFEHETFQHVRTEYHQTIESPIAANKPGESAG